jgi:uncharacterized protein (DUF4415 family)
VLRGDTSLDAEASGLSNAAVPFRRAPPKASISLRLDADVLEWLKAQGPGYQTRINAILRAFKEASA